MALNWEKKIELKLYGVYLAAGAVLLAGIVVYWYSNNKELASKIPGEKLIDESITSAQLANNAVTTEKVADTAITSAKLAKDAVSMDKLEKKLAAMIQTATPPGTINAFAGEDVPIGWMLCDGRPLNSKDYPALYRAISTNWGAGYYWEGTNCLKKDSCDFNLPDLRGLFLRGVDNRRGGVFGDPDAEGRTFAYTGGATGDHVGSYQVDAFQNHQHRICWGTKGGPGRWGVAAQQSFRGSIPVPNPKNDNYTDIVAQDVLNASITSETRPRNAYVNYIIKCDTKISDDNPVPEKNWVVSLKTGVDLEMIWVKPGTFTMGSSTNEIGHLDNEIQHEVTLTKGFWLGKYEVKQVQYEAVMGNNPNPSAKNIGIGNDYPVNNVSYYDALEFCRLLTEKERAEGRLPDEYKYTLPTEAQWEYACRAGTTTALNNGKELTSGTDFCNNLDEVGWFGNGKGTGGNANGKAHPVGEKKPNEWGFYDMHGNVWEWCLDWPTKKSLHEHRGGGWWDIPQYCRSATRYSAKPDYKHDHLGFRLALVSVQ